MKKTDNIKNRLFVRIYNANQIKDMEGLIASGKFDSKSAIIGKCVDIALPLLLNGKAQADEKKEQSNLSIDALKKQGAMLRDMSVILNITFNLVQSLFTEKGLALDGLKTNATDLNSGVYEQLPEHYQNILNELLKV